MKAAENLKSGHMLLAHHFDSLGAKRDKAPLYAIEHGLDEISLRKMRADLSHFLEEAPDLRRPIWLERYLPLLVVVTEVGYRYRGTGTDFWPVLASELGVDADHQFRLGVTGHFEEGHRIFGLARPGTSPWEQHFPLIAWPVGNALVPVEIQSRLADALRRAIRSGISADEPEALLNQVAILAAGHGSIRFENWLRQEVTASEIMRRLLLPDATGWLSEGILRRIDADIRKDPVAQRAMADARSLVVRKSGRSTDFPASRLFLRMSGGVPVGAFIRGPALPMHLRVEVISAMRILNDRLRVSGSDNVVSLHSFLAGGDILLPDLHNIPSNPLRRDDMTPLANDSDPILGKMQPRETSFFQVEDEDQMARAIFPGDSIPASASVIETLPAGPDDLPRFRRFSASVETDASYLRRQGFRLTGAVTDPGVIGLPMPGAGSTFSTTFPVFVKPGVSIAFPQPSGNNRPVSPASPGGRTPLAFFLDAGTHTAIRPLSADGKSDENLSFAMVEPAELRPATISVLPAKATLDDLRKGNLEIRIHAPVAVDSVSVILRLTSASHPEISSATVIDRLPKTLTGHSPVFDPLRAGLAENAYRISGAQLTIEAPGFLPVRISLPPVPRELHYSPVDNHWAANDGETKSFSSLSASPTSPLLASTNEDDGFRLLLPLAPDMDALPAGIVRSPEGAMRPGSVTIQDVNLPPLLREQDSRAGTAGLTDIVRSGLAWQMAGADNLLTEWCRRSVADKLEFAAVGLLCGKAWQKIDETIDRSALTQHGALLRRAQQLGLISGEDLPVVDDSADRMFLRDRLLTRVTAIVPDLSHSLEYWAKDVADNLDLAVIEAYEDLRLHQQASGRESFDDVDISRPEANWQRALVEARDMPLLSMFRPYILPAARWEALRNPFYEGLTEDDLVDLLDESHVDASRRSGMRRLGRPELRSLLQLWLSPRLLIESSDWPATLNRCLSDPHSARAVRYAALRYRLARQDIPDRSAL
ncbi:hypothetical protein [Asticcacaulis sp.]|uniref:hypothetical protein n=1 Tax=Asticcacaulis sp. TaxID=1872648 RepID=UPI002C82A759|nr:hypothetical protein [Asticcacaulis sp.]HTM81943.1 hypothetical protein [Asticcacaulis sp.]